MEPEIRRSSPGDRLFSSSVDADQDSQQNSVHLSFVVSRELRPTFYQPVATTRLSSATMSRDMKKIATPSGQVRLCTGDRVRIEVNADRQGFILIFNVGPTGQLNLLYPDEPTPAVPMLPIDAHTPLNVLEVEMTPPAGREQLFALWCTKPRLFSPQELLRLGKGEGLSHPRQLGSDPSLGQDADPLQQLPWGPWFLTTLELNHH